MHTLRTPLVVLFAITVGFAVVGCGDSTAKSPEDVFAKAKAINTNKSWGDMIDIIAPADREPMVFGMFFGAGFMTMANEDAKKELEALSKKHGLDKTEEEAGTLDLTDENAINAHAKKVLAGKDLKALMQDLGDFMAKYSDDFGKEEFKEMTELKIDGSTATAKIDGKEHGFKQIDGAWYLDVN